MAALVFWAVFYSSRWPSQIGPTADFDGAFIPPPLFSMALVKKLLEFSIFRSKFASPPVVSGLNIPEWQMVKPEPIEEKLVMPNFDGIKGGPDLVMNNSAIEPETETPPSSEID